MKKGFTLIELLVVIAIIGILSAIIITSYHDAQNQANNPTDTFTSTDAGVDPMVFPTPDNYVMDIAGILTPEQEASLNALLASTTNPSKIQIAVLTLASTRPLEMEKYSIRLAEKWKVGYKGADNGAIIIIAVEDRKVRIEVGHGLEGSITDAQADHILQNDMVPKLKDKDWYGGIFAGINSLDNLVK